MADTKKYLDLAGLASYDALIKAKIDAADSANQAAISAEETRAKAAEGANATAISTEKTRAEGVEGALTDLTTDAKGNLVAAINEVDANANAANTAIGIEPATGVEGSGLKKRISDLEKAIGEGGSVASQIKAEIEKLDADITSAAVEEGKGLQVEVKEVDGKVSEVTVTGNFDNKYDALGAAAAVNNSLKEIAKSGKAADVSVEDTAGLYTANTVEGALAELAQTSGIIATAVQTLANGQVKTNKEAIEAINNETTGILVQAKTYTNTSIGTLGDKSEGVAYANVKDYVDTKVGEAGTAGKVTLTTADTPTAGYLKTYVVSQGSAEVGKIDIPKDLVVTSGEVVKDPEGQPAGTYIKLTIANQEAPIYINVKDLIDIYTAAKDATQVQIAISDTNVVSATLVAGGVGTTELADAAVTNAKIADATIARAKIDAAFEAQIAALETASTTGVDGKIKTAIEGLDAEKSQAASSTNGLSLSITEVDGKITAISGNIATIDTEDITALFTPKTTEGEPAVG